MWNFKTRQYYEKRVVSNIHAIGVISVIKSVKKPIGVLLELFMKPKIARRVGLGLRTFVGFLRWLKCTRYMVTHF